MNDYPKGKVIYSRTGNYVGELTGSQQVCKLEGCTGVRLGVRWVDKKISYPCTKGITERADGALQIE